MDILIRTHAGLMLIAFGLVVGGFLVARIARKKRWWLKFHRALGIIGTSAMVLGLFAGTLDISLTDGSTLPFPTPGSAWPSSPSVCLPRCWGFSWSDWAGGCLSSDPCTDGQGGSRLFSWRSIFCSAFARPA